MSTEMNAHNLLGMFIRCLRECGHSAEEVKAAVKSWSNMEIAEMGTAVQRTARWAVFCDTCGTTWSVPQKHPGKDRCDACKSGSAASGGGV